MRISGEERISGLLTEWKAIKYVNYVVHKNMSPGDLRDGDRSGPRSTAGKLSTSSEGSYVAARAGREKIFWGRVYGLDSRTWSALIGRLASRESRGPLSVVALCIST
ncbi:hypothetical protein CRG98_007162 [Punica granatum]|uniref:Uncharacterized protein n=1 Tax=Punica granatum TaxID=22663 RepID=A0A2I0KX57_PUNGR|nr:hypothetical protein CRG98_007162 [Punica granatum]